MFWRLFFFFPVYIIARKWVSVDLFLTLAPEFYITFTWKEWHICRWKLTFFVVKLYRRVLLSLGFPGARLHWDYLNSFWPICIKIFPLSVRSAQRSGNVFKTLIIVKKYIALLSVTSSVVFVWWMMSLALLKSVLKFWPHEWYIGAYVLYSLTCHFVITKDTELQ